PLRNAQRRIRINSIQQRAHAWNAKWNCAVGLNLRGPGLVDGTRLAHVCGVPVVAIDAHGERLLLCGSEARSVGSIGISMNVEDIDGARARDLILPVNFVQ